MAVFGDLDIGVGTVYAVGQAMAAPFVMVAGKEDIVERLLLAGCIEFPDGV